VRADEGILRSSRKKQIPILTLTGFYGRIHHVAEHWSATVAQPVEQLTRNEQVVRSNRISSSKKPYELSLDFAKFVGLFLAYKVLPQIFCNTFCNMVLSATFSNGLHRVFAR
jgi:hypothetical protein